MYRSKTRISKYEADILKYLKGKPVHLNEKIDPSSETRRKEISFIGHGIIGWDDPTSKELSLQGDINLYAPDVRGNWHITAICEKISFRVTDITREGEIFGLAGTNFRTKERVILTRNLINGTIITGISETDHLFLTAMRYKKQHFQTLNDTEMMRIKEIHTKQETTIRKETERLLQLTEENKKYLIASK